MKLLTGSTALTADGWHKSHYSFKGYEVWLRNPEYLLYDPQTHEVIGQGLANNLVKQIMEAVKTCPNCGYTP